MLYAGNDNDVTVDGLRHASTGAYINDATLTFTAYDSDGDAVAGATAVSMAYVASSNGNYRGVLPSSAGLVAGSDYRIVIAASNYNYQTELRETCVKRTG